MGIRTTTALLYLLAGSLSRAETIVAAEPQKTLETIAYKDGDTPGIAVQVKYRTLIELDKSEQIMDAQCGFSDEWEVYNPDNVNFIGVMPKKAGASTDIIITTKSGNAYSFWIHDVSKEPGAHALTRVRVSFADLQMAHTAASVKKYYTEADLAAAQMAGKKAEDAARAAQAQAEQAVKDATAKAQLEAEKEIKHDYSYNQAEAAKAPFNVTAIYHDGKFTHIVAAPSMQWAVYSQTDDKKKPEVINVFPGADGTYRLDRIVRRGYFQLDKKQLKFELSEGKG